MHTLVQQTLSRRYSNTQVAWRYKQRLKSNDSQTREHCPPPVEPSSTPIPTYYKGLFVAAPRLVRRDRQADWRSTLSVSASSVRRHCLLPWGLPPGVGSRMPTTNYLATGCQGVYMNNRPTVRLATRCLRWYCLSWISFIVFLSSQMST
jgi:hypothetical protein